MLAALTLAGCARVAPGGPAAARHAYTIPHVLRFSTSEDVTTLNPHLTSQVTVDWLAQLTMAWLLRWDRANRPAPELATMVPTRANGGISPDGRTIVYHLRRDAKWSDGAPFTADDVVFTTKTVLNPATNEASRYGFDGVIAGIERRDTYTVAVHLRKPYAAFIPQFFSSGGVVSLLPAHLLAQLPTINTAPYNALPVGIGPFRYIRWKRGDAIEMEANPNYFRGKPKLKRVIFKSIPDRNTLFAQMESHELDLWIDVRGAQAERLAALPGVRLLRQPSFTASAALLNTAREPFKERAVREAFRLTIPRAQILATTYHGIGRLNESFYAPAHPMHVDIPFIEPNPARARTLLDGAGWRSGADGIRSKNGLRLTIVVAGGTGLPDADNVLELMRGPLRDAGFEMSIRRYPASLRFGPVSSGGILGNGKFDMTLASQTLDSLGDISVSYACDQYPPQGFNFGHFCDAALDADFARFNAEYAASARKPIAARIQRRIAAAAPSPVLFSPDDLHAMNGDLTGFAPNQITYLDDMMDVDI
ncbi:MAG: peptide ABC transporter substrate-binding protein [Candidatus Velthaea sp.]